MLIRGVAGTSLMIMVLLLSAVVSADSPVLSLNDQVMVGLAPHLRVFEDSSRALDLVDVNHTRYHPAFKSLSDDKLTLTNVNANYWVRLDLVNADATQARNWYLHNRQQPGIRHLSLFESVLGGGFRRVVTGDTEPYSSRDVDNLSYIFRLSFAPGERKRVYLLIDDIKLSRSVPLVLKSEDAFQRFDRFSWMLISGYYSVVVALFLYNLLLWFKLRERAQLIYLCYISCFVISMAAIDGVAALLQSYGFADLSVFSDEAYVMVMLTVQVAFVANLLDLKTNMPSFTRVYNGLLAYITLFAALYFMLGRTPLTQSLFSLAMAASWLFLISVIIFGIRQQVTGAKNLLVAELSMISGYLVATLAYYGVFPDNSFTSYMPAKVGNLVQLIFFSMVIGERARMAIFKSAEDRHELIVAQASAAAAKALSLQDPLTGLNNRRAFFEFGRQIVDESHRYRQSCSAIMLDIDFFKSINDRFGHQVGDRAICCAASLCQTLARDADVVGRLGGEEFAIILPSTDLEGARQLAERIRGAIESAFVDAGDEQVAMTVSVGVAELLANSDSADAMLNRADQALYDAKREGRNKVLCASATELPSGAGVL